MTRFRALAPAVAAVLLTGVASCGGPLDETESTRAPASVRSEIVDLHPMERARQQVGRGPQDPEANERTLTEALEAVGVPTKIVDKGKGRRETVGPTEFVDDAIVRTPVTSQTDVRLSLDDEVVRNVVTEARRIKTVGGTVRVQVDQLLAYIYERFHNAGENATVSFSKNWMQPRPPTLNDAYRANVLVCRDLSFILQAGLQELGVPSRVVYGIATPYMFFSKNHVLVVAGVDRQAIVLEPSLDSYNWYRLGEIVQRGNIEIIGVHFEPMADVPQVLN